MRKKDRLWLVENGELEAYRARVSELFKEHGRDKAEAMALSEARERVKGRGGVVPETRPYERRKPLKSDRRTCSYEESVEWVAQHLSEEIAGETRFEDRPSDDAWALFEFARTSEQSKRDFFMGIYSKLASTKAERAFRELQSASLEMDAKLVEKVLRAAVAHRGAGRKDHPWQ